MTPWKSAILCLCISVLLSAEWTRADTVLWQCDFDQPDFRTGAAGLQAGEPYHD